MAELVDALVSNTSGFISMPVRPRLWVLTLTDFQLVKVFILLFCITFAPHKQKHTKKRKNNLTTIDLVFLQ